MARRAFVIGGTGQIGWAICHDLLAHGWEGTVSHRGQSETLPPSEPVHFYRALAAS
jgi:NAD(P)-dependent dehydrogenase (short-subunit alcohol dehydrogenase family)